MMLLFKDRVCVILVRCGCLAHVTHTLDPQDMTEPLHSIISHVSAAHRDVSKRLRTIFFFIFGFIVNNTGGESQNVNLSLVADNTMLHRSLEVLALENHMEPAEAATALDAIFTDSARVFMAYEDDEQLPSTLTESLASIEAEVEHAANSGTLQVGMSCGGVRKLQKTVEEMCTNNSDVL